MKEQMANVKCSLMVWRLLYLCCGQVWLCGSASLFRSLMAASSAQTQQIAITDLDLPQLSDVRRQLEEVHIFISCQKIHTS